MDCRDTVDCIKRLKGLGSNLHTVEVNDGSLKSIVAMPKTRTRWKTLERTLDDLGWRQVHAKEKGGGILGVYSLENDDAEFIDDAELPDDAHIMLKFAEKVAALCLKAQQLALKEQNKQSKSLMDGHAALARVLTDRLVSLERMYAANLRLAQNSVEQSPDGEGALLSGEMLQAFVMSRMAPGAGAPAKPNGEKK